MDSKIYVDELAMHVYTDISSIPSSHKFVENEDIFYMRKSYGGVRVLRFNPEKLEELIDNIGEKYPGEEFYWTVQAVLRSDEVDKIFKRRGFVLDTISHNYYVSAKELLQLPGVSEEFEVKEVNSRELVLDYLGIVGDVFNDKIKATDERVEHELNMLTENPRRRYAFLIYEKNSGRVASMFHATLYSGKDILYLSGSATLPDFRKRGLYVASISYRAKLACELGVAGVISIGQADTSGPILESVGLTKYGQEDYWKGMV